MDSHILRFKAKMKSDSVENCKRTFIISAYLCDDSIAIHEVPTKHSGILFRYESYTILFLRARCRFSEIYFSEKNRCFPAWSKTIYQYTSVEVHLTANVRRSHIDNIQLGVCPYRRGRICIKIHGDSL